MVHATASPKIQLMQEIKKVASLIYLNGGHVNPDIRIYINEIYDTKIQELRGTVNNIRVGTIIDSYKIAINKEIIKKLTKHFGISSAQIQIKTGYKSQEKIIEISQ